MKGIYAYVDTMDNSVVYVGRDSSIDKHRRHNEHMRPSLYNEQKINQILQNNPNRYEYKKVFVFDDITDTELNQLEMQQIALFNPKFNFTKGGYGHKGVKHSEETRRKIGEKNSGKNNGFYGKKHSDETKKRISESLSGELHPLYGKKRPLDACMNISKNQGTTGYFRVMKENKPGCKQGFIWTYRYYEDKKYKSISSVDFKKLEERVKAKGLEWYKFEEVEE